LPKVRRRKITPEPVVAQPEVTKRGRAKKIGLLESFVEPNPDKPVKQKRSKSTETVVAIPQTVVENAPALPVKARGRAKKAVEIEVLPEVIAVKGRKPKSQVAITPTESELFEEAQPVVVVHPETLEVIEEAPAAKKTVRLRREAREHVFSHQGGLHNPYEALLEHFRTLPNGLSSRELSNDLDEALLERLGGRKGLEEAVIQLEQHGYLMTPKRGIFQVTKEFIPIVGRIEIRADGTGWFTPDTPGLRSMLIAASDLLFAWHGDRVVARELRRNGQSEGEVIRVLERARDSLTGTLEHQRGYALVRPDETSLPSLVLEANSLASGTRLVASLLYPEDSGEDETVALVKTVLGDASSVEAERAAVMTRFALVAEFSSQAKKEAHKLGVITAKDMKGRIDLRGKRVYALTGFERALQIEPLGNGNILLAVHYADAAHWIDEGSALETAILERGTGLHLSGQELPLLPLELQEAIQFTQNKDRLALSVLIETSSTGDLVNYVVRPSVVGVVANIANASEQERELIGQIGGLESALALATRLCATAIAASDVTALYRTKGEPSPELASALERSSGFDAGGIVIKTLRCKLTKPSSLTAIHSSAATDGLGLSHPLSKAADLLNIRILTWCATKLSVRKREQLLETLPGIASNLQRLEQRNQNAQSNLEQFRLIQSLTQPYPMRGVVIGISEFALEIVLENGAIGTLALEDLGEEVTYSPHQWKTRLGRVFKPGSIVRVVVEKTRPATREAQLALHQKESHMSRLRRRKPGANASSTSNGAKPGVGTTSIARRGVVVLGNRPRAEYPRPVRITARKLYFGEWSRERFVELEGDNPEFDMAKRPASRQNFSKPMPKGNAEVRAARPHEPQRQHQPRRPEGTALSNPNPNPNQQRRPQHAPAAQPDTSRNSRIEALRQRQLQALERNANRAQNGPAPVVTPTPAPVEAVESSKPAYRSRRPNRSKAPSA
jgi:exoribonuclease R